ncbi:hypothetical protein SAY86_027720 [Trapa natans]|uniref:Uncharacterized protein n=1 Tax=Trapa natans TaxID=22666 RepID=A0AAN7KTL8_TRANT|nr:hypothetical protein SAY86_027720 [Trapa natans]
MAFDQNSSAPSDQRRVNIGRTTVEDRRFVAPAMVVTATRTPAGEGGFLTNYPCEAGKGHQSISVFYPAAGISEGSFGGLGFGKGVPSLWYPPHGAVGQMGHSVNPTKGYGGAVGPIKQMSVNPTLGLGFSPNVVPAVSGNTVDQLGSSEVVTKFGVSSLKEAPLVLALI